MPIVIDSSVAASWGIPDERSEAADLALTAAVERGMIVPDIFWHELRNVLLVNERRGRLTVELSRRALELVDRLSPRTDGKSDHEAVLNLARRHSLSAYDAAFLELALRSGGELATLDRRLADAARSEGLAPITG